ncbi:hypothetical protein D3C71_365020 [compost metagenome]
MAGVDITMSVDGGDFLNSIDLLRLKEVWEQYAKTLNPIREVYTFDRMKDRVQRTLQRHIERHPTWFGSRPIYIRGAMIHRADEYDRQVVILPQRATWDAVNHGYDYLRNEAPQPNEPDFDSTIRHWAGDHLAKYLDNQNGFSRRKEDRQDCFNLIQVLDVAKRQLYDIVDSIGTEFETVEVPENDHVQRDVSLKYIIHSCKPLPV